MDMKRSLCLEVGGFPVSPIFLLPLLGLMILGCGDASRDANSGASRVVKPPPDLPAIANDRYERVQVAIDGKPIDTTTTITVGRDFIVTVSFRRLHVWSGMNNSESFIHPLVMEKLREHTVTRRSPSLNWQSEKDGILTFSGKVEALQESGVFGLWIRETVVSETVGMERYFLFATNIRSVKP